MYDIVQVLIAEETDFLGLEVKHPNYQILLEGIIAGFYVVQVYRMLNGSRWNSVKAEV